MGESATGELSWLTRAGEAGMGVETARDLVRVRKLPTLIILWLLLPGVSKSGLPVIREIRLLGGDEGKFSGEVP